MMQIILWSNNGEWVETDNLESIREAVTQKEKRIWVDVTDPTDANLNQLEQMFQLHPLSTRAIRERVDDPKMDIYDEYVFLVLHRIFYHFQTENCELREFEVSFSKNFIITTHTQKLSRTFATAREKIKEHRKDCISHGPSYVLFRLLNLCVQDYNPAIQEWQDDLDEIEQRVLLNVSDHILEKILDFKKLVTRMRKQLLPEREVLSELYENRNIPFIPASMRPYFKVITDNMNAVLSDLESLRDHATSVFDIYAAMLTIKMTEASHQINFVMQRLTIAATIFLPLTFIVGVYGMNFDTFPELHWKWAYPALWGIMITLTTVMLYFFKKKKWI